MKRLVFCFDGTWNNLDTGHVTNVGITAQSIAASSSNGTQQIVYYDEGVGNSRRDANYFVKKIEKYGGGLFGHGLLANLIEAYKFLIFNYQPGDEIFVFGFSRGAFSARSFTGLLHACGVLRKSNVEHISEAVLHYQNLSPQNLDDKIKLRQFRWQYGKEICVDDAEEDWRCESFENDYKRGDGHILRIDYLGVWDTVGSLGIPNHWGISKVFNHRYRFHDCRLSQFVKRARHAVAVDEKRKTFAPTIWDNIDDVNAEQGFESSDLKAPYQEVWFPGTHGSVGGGGGIRGLSDEALHWILSGAREIDLELDTEDASEVFNVKPNFRASIDNVGSKAKKGIMSRAMAMLPESNRSPGPQGIHQVSMSARYRWGAPSNELPDAKAYRPKTLSGVAEDLDKWVSEELQPIATTAFSGAPETKSIEREHHVVEAGDTLGKIAKKYYGDAAYYKPLFRVNRPLLSNPDAIFLNQEIWLPPKGLLDLMVVE